MKRNLLKLCVLLLSAFLIAACSTNSDEPEENGGGNGNGTGDNGDGGDEEENELEGYFLWDWESFDYVFGSLYDVHENNYRLPFKNVDANPDDYKYGHYVDSLIYPAVIIEAKDGVRTPLDTNAYMVIYMVAGESGFSLTAEHKYGDGDFFSIHSRFYTGYKPKEVNFLYKQEDMQNYWIKTINTISFSTGGYFDIQSAISLCSINRYWSISQSGVDNLYFLEKPRKAN